MDAPDGAKLTKATTALVSTIEAMAARAFVFFGKRSNAARHDVLDQNPIVREQLALSLASALQHSMHFILASLAKICYYPLIPPEIVMLNSLRGLLGSLSVAFNAMIFVLHYAKAQPQSIDAADIASSTNEQELSPEEAAQALVDIMHWVRPVKKVQQEILQADEDRQQQERDAVLAMMETTVGLPPSPKPNETSSTSTGTRPTGPEPPRPADIVAKPPKVDPKQEPKPEPAKLVAKPDPKPEPSKVDPKSSGPRTGAGAGQTPLKDSKPDPKADPKGKGKGKDDGKKEDPKGKGKVKDSGKNDTKPAATTPATQPAKPATPAASPATGSTSSTSPAPAPAPAAAAVVANADGSIPCPVAGLPPLPAGWKIDDITETNLPPGFPEAPAKPVPLAKGASEDEYKAWMKLKYDREGWDNKLILYKIRMTNVLKSMGKM